MKINNITIRSFNENDTVWYVLKDLAEVYPIPSQYNFFREVSKRQKAKKLVDLGNRRKGWMNVVTAKGFVDQYSKIDPNIATKFQTEIFRSYMSKADPKAPLTKKLVDQVYPKPENNTPEVPNAPEKFERVFFRGNPIRIIQTNEEVLVSVHDLCNGIGINTFNQVRNLRYSSWGRQTLVYKPFSVNGKTHSLPMIPLSTVTRLLSEINSRSGMYSPSTRPSIKEFGLHFVSTIEKQVSRLGLPNATQVKEVSEEPKKAQTTITVSSLNVMNFQFDLTDIRVTQKDDQVWFVLNDVAEALGVVNSSQVRQRLDEDDRASFPIADRNGRIQPTSFVNEAGLYSIILTSRKPEALRFKRWVTKEVLPSIRRTGTYSMVKDEPSQVVSTLKDLSTESGNMVLMANHVHRLTNVMQEMATQMDDMKKTLHTLVGASSLTSTTSTASVFRGNDSALNIQELTDLRNKTSSQLRSNFQALLQARIIAYGTSEGWTLRKMNQEYARIYLKAQEGHSQYDWTPSSYTKAVDVLSELIPSV